MNIFNKILTALLLVFAAVFIKLISDAKPFVNRYYYAVSVSSPTYFPIANVDVYFVTEANEHVFTSAPDSDWQFREFSSPEESKAIPAYLIVHYLDYRTVRFYNDSIKLDKEKIRNTIKSIPRDDLFLDAKIGMYIPKILVGIAGKGKVLLAVQTKRKVEKLAVYNLKSVPAKYKNIVSKEDFLNNFFKGMVDDSIAAKIQKGYQNDADYTDSLNIEASNFGFTD